MRRFLTALFVFSIWFVVVFFYLSKDTPTPSLSLKDDFLSKKPSIDSVLNVQSDSLPISIDTHFVLEKNHAKLYINDKHGAVIMSLDSVYIKKNSDSVYLSHSPDVYFKPLISHLEKIEDVEIIINSEYSATENFDIPNIGTKRGEYLVSEMVKAGINPYILSIKSIIREINFDEDKRKSGTFSFQLKPLDKERKAEIENNRVISQIVYPSFTFSKIIVNKELKDYANELKNIFESNPNRNATIIGHTDNIGSAIDNYKQGLKYAQQVRWFLINRHDFNPSRLKATSQGEKNPIDDNTSQSGRNNNLRIEFLIE